MIEKANTPSIRFEGFNKAWEQCKLSDYGKTESGIGFPIVEQGRKNGIPLYKVSDMNLKGNENAMHSANNYVEDVQLIEKNWTPITELPAIIFAKVGAAVMLNRKRMVKQPFLIDNNMMAYKFSSSLDELFGQVLFDKIDIPSLIQTGALPSIKGSDIENVTINIPTKIEQEKIGILFNKVNNLITLHQRKYIMLTNIKKSLLNKMFV